MARCDIEGCLVGRGQVDVHLEITYILKAGRCTLYTGNVGKKYKLIVSVRHYIGIGGWPWLGCLWWVALPVQVNSKEGDGEDEEDEEDEGEGEGAVLQQEEVIRCHKDEYLKGRL